MLARGYNREQLDVRDGQPAPDHARCFDGKTLQVLAGTLRVIGERSNRVNSFAPPDQHCGSDSGDVTGAENRVQPSKEGRLAGTVVRSSRNQEARLVGSGSGAARRPSVQRSASRRCVSRRTRSGWLSGELPGAPSDRIAGQTECQDPHRRHEVPHLLALDGNKGAHPVQGGACRCRLDTDPLAPGGFEGGFERSSQHCWECEATPARNTSAGVRQPRVLRGLLLRRWATACSAAAEWMRRSVPFGKYWRNSPAWHTTRPPDLSGSFPPGAVSCCLTPVLPDPCHL